MNSCVFYIIIFIGFAVHYFNFLVAVMEPTKSYPGITSPISLEGPKPLDLKLSEKMEEAMRPHGVFESEAEMSHRLFFTYSEVQINILQSNGL